MAGAWGNRKITNYVEDQRKSEAGIPLLLKMEGNAIIDLTGRLHFSAAEAFYAVLGRLPFA